MRAIYQKIAVVKATIGAIQKDATNPFHKSKYFDINSLLHQLEPLLEDQGLVVLQPIIDGSVVTQIVDVDTGETLESSMKLPDISDPQKIGSAITYYRRYSLQSLLSLQAEDDDGNLASGKVKEDDKPKEETIWLTEEQFKAALKATPKQIENTIAKYSKKPYAMQKAYREKLNNKLNELKNVLV